VATVVIHNEAEVSVVFKDWEGGQGSREQAGGVSAFVVEVDNCTLDVVVV